LIASAFYLIVILLSIKPVTIYSRTGFLPPSASRLHHFSDERKNSLHLPFTQRTIPKITGFFFSPEPFQGKKNSIEKRR